jgi:hypothetical protein
MLVTSGGLWLLNRLHWAAFFDLRALVYAINVHLYNE